MEHEEYSRRVTCVVGVTRTNMADDIRFLLGKRSEHDKYLPGVWGPITGTVDPSDYDTPNVYTACAERELSEEIAGISLQALLLYGDEHVFERPHERVGYQIVLAYIDSSIELTPAVGPDDYAELDEVRWFSGGELRAYLDDPDIATYSQDEMSLVYPISPVALQTLFAAAHS